MSWIEWGVIYLAVLYLIFAIDDLIFDVTYWVGAILGWWNRVVLTQTQLESEPEARVAIIIPAWAEAAVIGRMLTYNAGRLDYGDYDFWIGTYPNDPETQTEVDRVRSFLPHVYRVTTGHDGPTSKADCLNAVLADVIRHEVRTRRRYDFVLMHDPEDIIHPLEPRVLNWHFRNTDADFIQMPVFSTAPNFYDFVAGTYIDEFAEMYAKNMHVRQLLSPFVPSAGVATGIRRSALDELVDTTGGLPFATNSLTEDYDLGLKMAIAGRKTRYVAQRVRLRAPENGKESEELVATFAPFPHTFQTAVRQRTRWMAGIVFQSWEQWRWPGGLGLKWMLAHDRRGPLGYLVLFFGYVLVFAILGYTWVRAFNKPELPAILNEPLFTVLFILGVLVMLNRLLQRAIAVGKFYGPGQAILAIFRTPFSNIVNMTAATRAAFQYFLSRRRGVPMAWDKTEHSIPPIVARSLRLGERLILVGKLTPQQLMLALGTQRTVHRPLGEILVEQGSVTSADVKAALTQ
ncbi:MAG: phage adsorption protein NrfB [Gemmatimonadota bacterium]|nr:phage adsorption protein NrfB [Gemmatimonadota bacterium]